MLELLENYFLTFGSKLASIKVKMREKRDEKKLLYYHFFLAFLYFLLDNVLEDKEK